LRLSTRPSVASLLNGAAFGDSTLAAAFAGAFLVLTGLVWAGVFTWLDRYSVGHLMPWAQFGPAKLISISTVFKPETRSTLGGTLVALWTYPASPFISGLVVLACAWRLPRRAGVVAIALWVAANAVELAGKVIVSRPFVGQPGFTHSFPSGHTVRAFVTAAILAWVWRRAAWPALAWAVGVACALVAIGDHVPTDVVGGVLLAACLVYSAGAALPTSSP
jgi:membrane-associated phospholipid phosphatase